MKCLVLSPFLPFPPRDGGRIRIYELLKRLARGHSVDLLSFAEQSAELEAATVSLRELGLRVVVVAHEPEPRGGTALRALATRKSVYGTLFWSRAFARALERLLRVTRYDIVQCEFSYMGRYVPPPSRGRPSSWILDEHNIEFRLNETIAETAAAARGLPYRLYARRERSRRREEELTACRRVDRVIAVSEVDRSALTDALGFEADIVPNGVDLEHFRPSGRAESRRRPCALFVGKMDYRPNVDAARWFCSEVLPLVRREEPGFAFTVCGSDPGRAVLDLSRDPTIRVTGAVLDTRPFLDEAAVVVVPLRSGSGTRLKILEALAAGRAVVTTTRGAEGLAIADGVHALVADAPRDFADRVVRLLRSPEERERIGRQGRLLVERAYGWDRSFACLERVYESVLAEKAVRAR